MRLFTRRELTIFFAVFLVVLVVSLAVAVSISLVRNRKAAPTAPVEQRDTEGILSFDDFLVPGDYRHPYHMDPMPGREPVEQWDDETAEKFSPDIPAMVLEIIRQENTARLLEGRD